MPSTPQSDPGEFRSVKSADRALTVLEYLAAHDHCRFAELARELRMPKSSLHALLQTMAARGWVEADRHRNDYRLGLRALLVGHAYIETDDVVAMNEPTLDWLADQTGETVHIGRLDGASIVYLAKRESRHPLRLFSAIGRRLPAFTTALGKALLAQLPEDELAAHLPDPLPSLTPKTITDRPVLLADLAATRKRGFAIDNEESTESIRGFAVALPTASPPVDAMSCAVPTARLDPGREAAIVEALQTALTMVGQRMRRAPPANNAAKR